MIKKSFVFVLLMSVILFSGCEKLWDTHKLSEEDIYNLQSGNVEFTYFIARGFNMRFVGILGVVEQLDSDESTYEFITDISLNIDDVFIANSKDVITVADNKKVDEYNNKLSNDYNPTFINCERNPMKILVNHSTVMGVIGARGDENGKITKTGVGSMSGTMYFVVGKTEHVFEFTIENGFLMASMPAQYIMGNGYASIPLKGSEVEKIISTGKEGVDYELFTRDNKTYVRIKNNLYERRYDSWVYAGIADPFFLTSWTRRQTTLIFDILDWDELTGLYRTFKDENYKIPGENRKNMYPGDYYTAGGSDYRVGGNRLDYYDITTPLMGCKK